jgi:hypothetical protein
MNTLAQSIFKQPIAENHFMTPLPESARAPSGFPGPPAIMRGGLYGKDKQIHEVVFG